jgi:hypothetical protein
VRRGDAAAPSGDAAGTLGGVPAGFRVARADHGGLPAKIGVVPAGSPVVRADRGLFLTHNSMIDYKFIGQV